MIFHQTNDSERCNISPKFFRFVSGVKKQKHFFQCLRLRGCVVEEECCVLSGLIPGSFYRFRIVAFSKNGMISDPGPESDPIFLGQQNEDEIFGLPGGNYPKEAIYGIPGRIHHVGSARKSKFFGSDPHMELISGKLSKLLANESKQVIFLSALLF